MRRFNSPRPFFLLPRVSILYHCDAFVANFIATEFPESESKAEPTLRLTSIDKKDEEINYTPMMVELPALTTSESHSQQRTEQRLSGQPVVEMGL
ncbi:hypothetical protein EVAR_69115_1 [Eumeta japonica]|uniref:Uncharacterized protein n=1 Tax=Eumeta variegata TaxID=151549 RepID=A0A4C1SZP3_EUMVA|nr:hypothetical protein EVAR_69115_1 [Eumeta japonica]